jgi:nondiscriminating glutamyl-tRNA synthetase
MSEKEKNIENPRVRIAPSPTGFLHIGTARTALFNYLFAQKYQGKFILRIEDTDEARSKKEYIEDIVEGLKWLKIFWDEGISPDDPSKELGKYGPYKQSQRKNIYKKYIQKLLDEDKAYFCFCTKEDLEAQRQYQLSIGQPPIYNGKCRNLKKETIQEFLKQGKPHIIRFKNPDGKIVFKDLIKGKIEFDASLIGDMTIAKDIDSPLYNLAAVIDDYEMKISHVLRGEDHISNTPKQILLQKALEIENPEYGHFPLILGPDKSKLSKRHGTVSVNQYRQEGYLPEAMVNFIAFLGWNPGTEKEIFPLNSLIKEFSLEHCRQSSSIFNLKKLNWINGFYIRNKSLNKLTELCLPYFINADLIEPFFETEEHLVGIGPVDIKQSYLIKETGEKIEPEKLEKIVEIYQERLKHIAEIVDLTDFFFKKELFYKKELLLWKKMEEKDLKNVLNALEGLLEPISTSIWVKPHLEDLLLKKATEIGPGGDRGWLLWPLRVALSGKKSSAPPFEIAEILGKEKTLLRLNQAKLKL